jgi:peptidoglycan/xylan/chitin deacetylase (PgdA/CDA1 family)
MEAILEAGYTPITFQQLIGYVEETFEMPQKPIIITIDDGYLNNYTLVYPILVELEIPATIFVIGWSRGRTHRMDGVTPINHHFSWQQAREMIDSGFIDIQSHTYELHWPRDEGFGRHLTLRNPNETLEEYFRAIRDDDNKLQAMFEQYLGYRANIFAYPHGLSNADSEAAYKAIGYQATLLFQGGVSVVEKGNPDSLFSLNRLNVTGEMTPEELIRYIERSLP